VDYRVYRKVLRMVGELHLRGYQKLRIAPGMSASGMHWRCSVTPASNVLASHGAMLQDWERAAHYSSGMEGGYFNWTDAAHCSPSRLAELFLVRFPEIAAAGYGSDWLYAGWYVEMLHQTYPDLFPIAYADWDVAGERLETTGGRAGIRLALPPPGEAA